MGSRASSSHLDVSGFFILVLHSGHTAVLLLQAGHAAFYDCDTRGRSERLSPIAGDRQHDSRKLHDA